MNTRITQTLLLAAALISMGGLLACDSDVTPPPAPEEPRACQPVVKGCCWCVGFENECVTGEELPPGYSCEDWGGEMQFDCELDALGNLACPSHCNG